MVFHCCLILPTNELKPSVLISSVSQALLNSSGEAACCSGESWSRLGRMSAQEQLHIRGTDWYLHSCSFIHRSFLMTHQIRLAVGHIHHHNNPVHHIVGLISLKRCWCLCNRSDWCCSSLGWMGRHLQAVGGTWLVQKGDYYCVCECMCVCPVSDWGWQQPLYCWLACRFSRPVLDTLIWISCSSVSVGTRTRGPPPPTATASLCPFICFSSITSHPFLVPVLLLPPLLLST